MLKAGFSSLVQALTRSALRSVSESDMEDTSDGTEEKSVDVVVAEEVVVPWGAKAVETPAHKEMAVANDVSSSLIVIFYNCR